MPRDRFPLQVNYPEMRGVECPSSVPWEKVAPHEQQAKENHGGQSLERLADRCGLSPVELYLVMHGRRWSFLRDEDNPDLQTAVDFVKSLQD